MKKALVIIDYQVDFVNGSLGCGKAAEDIEENIINKVQEFEKYYMNYIENKSPTIFITLDTHTEKEYKNSFEGSLFTPHCIKYTDGWLPYGKLKQYINKPFVKVIEKNMFGSTQLLNKIHSNNITYIDVVGIATNICVLHNVIMLYNSIPNIQINVISNCCASFDETLHIQALEMMKGFSTVI